MATYDLEDSEVSRIISALATQDALIHKLSQQAIAHKKGNGHAAEVGFGPGHSVEQHPRNDPSGPPAAAGGGGSAQHRAAKPARR